MRIRIILALAMTLLLSAYALAQDAPKPEPKKEAKEKPADKKEDKQPADTLSLHKQLLKDVGGVIGKVTLGEADVQSFIDNRESFAGAMKGDDKFAKLWNSDLKGAFDHALASEAYKKWAAGRKLNAEDWLRKALRVQVLGFRLRVLKETPDKLKKLARQCKKLEAEKQTLSTGEYEHATASLQKVEKLLKGLEELAKTLPEPADAEKKAIEAHESELQ